MRVVRGSYQQPPDGFFLRFLKMVDRFSSCFPQLFVRAETVDLFAVDGD